jgi:hypothetical protein
MRDRSGRGRKVAVVAALGALVGATLATTGLGTANAAPRAAASNIVQVATTTALALPAPGLQVVQSVNLTKGTWSLFAKATAINAGTGDFFRCQLVDVTHSNPLDGSTTFLNAGVPRDVITNIGLIKVKTTVTVKQECGHDGDAGDAGSIDAGASLVGFVTPAARVRIARTTTQSNVGTTPTGILNLSLPKGTWVIATKFTPVALSVSEAEVGCRYDADLYGRLVGTDAGDHAVSTVFRVDTTAPVSTTTLTLSCQADPGAYIDPGTVFWAWKATSAQAADTSACPVTLEGTALNDALVLHARDCNVGAGSFPTEMIGAHLGAGTWIGLGAFDDLESNGTSVARCQILDATHGKQLDVASTAEDGGGGAPTTGISNVTVVRAKKAVDVEGRCGLDTVDTTGFGFDSGWAFIKP